MESPACIYLLSALPTLEVAFTKERRGTGNQTGASNLTTTMVMAVRDRPRHQQSSYCPCCDRQFNSLERPRDNTDRAKVTVPPSSHPCQTVCHDVPGEDNLDWSTDVRPEVKFASLVQFISCHSCNGRHRNPPYDNM